MVSHLSSLVTFEERARAGEALSVVFLGGSVTWGANATDPERTSWRGLMMRFLLERHPKTQFTFVNAAIGGTGSDLALFRIDRDVLPYKPDLCFFDFSVNDNADGTDEQPLASYERCLRDLLSSRCAVLPILLCFRHHVESSGELLPPRHEAHLKLASAYGLPVANTLPALRKQIHEGVLNSADLWIFPRDGSHPGDAGYAAFFAAIRDDYEKALAVDSAPHLSDATVFPNLYPARHRQILVDGRLPRGWAREPAYRTSMWFDGLSSRWMGDVAAARVSNGEIPQPLEIKFMGSMVGLFGERDAIAPPFRAWIDDQLVPPSGSKQNTKDLWDVNTTRFATPAAGPGRLFLWIMLTKDLPDREHTLRIEPDFTGAHAEAELRLESVCSAGR